MPWVLYFSLRQLRAYARHTLPAVLALAAGTLGMLVVFSFSAGFDDHLEQDLLGLVPHLYLEPGIVHWLQADLSDTAGGVPGVAEVAPYLAVSGLLQRGDIAETVTVRGVDWEQESLPVQGDGGAVIGEALARRLHVHIGDALTLTTAAQTFEVQVAGTFRTGYYQQDAEVVYLPLRHVQEVLGVSGISGYGVRADDLSALDRLADRLAAATDLWVQPWYYRHSALYAAWQGQRIGAWVCFGFFTLLIVVGMANFLHQLTFRQTQPMWTLRVMGASPQQLARLVVLQAVILGAVGAAVGTGAGWLLVRHFAAFPVILPDVFYLRELPILWAAHRLGWVWLAVVGGSWVGALYPLLHASQVGLEEVTVDDYRAAR